MKIEKKLLNKFSTLSYAYRVLDQKRDGKLSLQEFMEGLLSLNLDIQEEIMRKVFFQLDIYSKGYLELSEFLKLGGEANNP